MKENNFSLEKFMNGGIAKTALGQTAKFLTISRNRLIVAFTSLNYEVSQETYQLDGKKYKNASHPFDLITVESK